MALPVDVRSTEELAAFRAALAQFGDDAKNALAAAEMEIHRMVDWLTHDRPLYWQSRIKRTREEVTRAKSELFRKRTSRMFGHEASMTEQRENLEHAQRRLEHAEKKLERVRKWAYPLQQAIMEYRSAASPLADMLDGELQRGLGRLAGMIRALEAYLHTRTPNTRSAAVGPAPAEGTGTISGPSTDASSEPPSPKPPATTVAAPDESEEPGGPEAPA